MARRQQPGSAERGPGRVYLRERCAASRRGGQAGIGGRVWYRGHMKDWDWQPYAIAVGAGVAVALGLAYVALWLGTH